jgi:hypothetical protein
VLENYVTLPTNVVKEFIMCREATVSDAVGAPSSNQRPRPTSFHVTPAQPSTSGTQTSVPTPPFQLDSYSESSDDSSSLTKLLSMFRSGQFSEEQVTAVYHSFGSDFGAAVECLLSPGNMVRHLNTYFSCRAFQKVNVDGDDLWQDRVVQYKAKLDVSNKVRVNISNQQAIDTGGLRRHVYSTVFSDFVSNKLFEGPEHSCRPVCTAESRSSGLFKILGKMVGHSIVQEGIGFPYLSHVCYSYIVGGDDKAMEHVAITDINEPAATVFQKVCCHCVLYGFFQYS